MAGVVESGKVELYVVPVMNASPAASTAMYSRVARRPASRNAPPRLRRIVQNRVDDNKGDSIIFPYRKLDFLLLPEHVSAVDRLPCSFPATSWYITGFSKLT